MWGRRGGGGPKSWLKEEGVLVPLGLGRVNRPGKAL